MRYQYQPETQALIDKLERDARYTVANQAMELGEGNCEPLLTGLDGMLRYAKAHRLRYDSPLSGDFVLGPEWLSVVKGLRGLLNGQGAVALELDRSTDSKDNGTLEALFWAALEAAGFAEEVV